MRIAINALPAKIGAGPTFYANFLPALAEIDTENEYLILLDADQENLFEVPPRFQKIVLDSVPKNYALRFAWEQFTLPMLLRKWKVDILYTQGNVTSIFAPCRKVVVVTGANPYSQLKFPQTLAYRIKHRIIRWVSIASARVSSVVLFISNDSRDLIYPRLRVPREKTDVVYYAWKQPDDVTAEAPPVENYVLTVSVLWPHKNLERLMRAFDRFVREHGYDGRLVIAGAPSSQKYQKELLAQRDALRHADRIVFTGKLNLQQLAGYYRNATMFIFPSLEETLGLPLLEAMGFGVPIAASDARLSSTRAACFSPFRELAGDAAIYFDPFDEVSMSEAMKTLLDPRLREDLSRRGRERIRRFTWERTAADTLAVLRRIGPVGSASEPPSSRSAR